MTNPNPPVSRRTDPETSHAAERALNQSGRRGSQKGRILARLRRGPATNAELAAISLKYTGRVSDLRADGHEIVVERADDSGVATYRLASDADRPSDPVASKAEQRGLFEDDAPAKRNPWSEEDGPW